MYYHSRDMNIITEKGSIAYSLMRVLQDNGAVDVKGSRDVEMI